MELLSFVMEGIDIHIPAFLLRGIVEYAELTAHEESLPVETQGVVGGTNLRPLLTIHAIVEIGGIPSVTTGRAEVCIDAQMDAGGGLEVQDGTFRRLLLNTSHFLVTF